MDNMAFGPERPQEDEIALCNLGAASPYRLWGFHDLRATPPESLELEGLPAAELERWKRMMLFFVKRLALHDARRIVLKSPTHTARIKTLLELFPDAQFVHIRRDPYKVFVSTLRTWTGLCDFLGLGRFRDEAIEEQVFASFVRMYRCFFRDRELLRPGQFHEVSYEELVADPCGVVQGIYEKLKLGDFESVRPKLKKFFDDAQDYRTNEYRLSPELRTKITDRWGEYIDALGYQREPIGT
jgi:hypothetical protein